MKPAFTLAATAAIACASIAQAQLFPFFRPGSEFRSLNTAAYEIAVQRNGRLDVVLVSGEPVFTNAFPMVWFDGEDKPERLPVDGRYSARGGVDDRLGQGQGMVLKKGPCEWHLRAYPATSFFAVQLAYVNTGRKPVAIRALLPWVIGKPKSGHVYLGEFTLDARVLAPQATLSPRIGTGPASAYTHLAAYNPVSGRSMVAGFITGEQSRPTISLGHNGDSEAFTSLRAMCSFDPPVVLQPGEQLRSGVLYLAIAEGDPFDALERYAAAVDVSGGAEVGALDTNPDYAQPIPIERWQAVFPNNQPGIVEAVRTAARRYYLAPRLSRHPVGEIALDAFDPEQRTAVLTIQSLLGGPLTYAPGSVDTTGLDEKLQPLRSRRARPVDLFEGGVPGIWTLNADSAAGDWTIGCVFNWNPRNPARTTTTLAAIDLDPSTTYTAFDFWQQEYYGLLTGELFVDVDPASVRVLGFRRYRGRPMLVGSDAHFTMGARHHRELDWNPATNMLSGTIESPNDAVHTLTLLVPSGYELLKSSESIIRTSSVNEKGTLQIAVAVNANAPSGWSLSFARN